MNGMLGKIVGVSIGLLVAALLLPIALSELAGSEANMTTAGVDSTVITIMCVMLPILAVISLAVYFLRN